MSQEQKTAEKSTSEQLGAVLAQLSSDQIRFVVARQECSTDGEAAKAIKLKPNTVYKWPAVVKEAVRLMAADGLTIAQHVLARSLAKAALVKAAGLDSGDERIRQAAATEIIDRAMGKATQRTEVSGPGGGDIPVKLKTYAIVSPDDWPGE